MTTPDVHSGYSAPPSTLNSLLRYAGLGFAVVFVAFCLYTIHDLRVHLDALESQVKDAHALQAKFDARISSIASESRASTEVLAARVGIAQKELVSRTAELRRSQSAAQTRLDQLKEEATAKIGAVSGEVAGVKTEVGGVRSDLESTRAKLERAIGDLGQQSGLIAHTREDLEALKHRGDRNYFEFTLHKGKATVPVSTISLQLKKTDAKKGKFTLNVIADDRTIEKKDRALFEPLQFYSGRDRALYELVINSVDKDRVSGYLSTPKTAASTSVLGQPPSQ